jgi:hypothetical protein
MKIASSGIGTVATAQGFNAKSAFPYVWAWNAVGATTGAGASGTHTVKTSQQATLSSDPEGVKHTSGGDNSFIAYRDEATDAADKTGKLDASLIDFTKARYMHGVFNMSGWTTPSGGFSNYSPGQSEGQLYYYSTNSNWNGHDSLKHIYLGDGRWIIVWDMLGGEIGGGGGTFWGDMTTLAPIHLEPWWGSAGAFPSGQSMVWCGMVLSDRILYNIPLPIRTHMG